MESVAKSVHTRHLFNRCFHYTPFICFLPVCIWPEFYPLLYKHVTFLQFGAIFTSHSTGLPSVNCPFYSLHTSLIYFLDGVIRRLIQSCPLSTSLKVSNVSSYVTWYCLVCVNVSCSVPLCPLSTPIWYSLLTLHPSRSLFQWQKQVGLIPYGLRRIALCLQGRDQQNVGPRRQSI